MAPMLCEQWSFPASQPKGEQEIEGPTTHLPLPLHLGGRRRFPPLQIGLPQIVALE